MDWNRKRVCIEVVKIKIRIMKLNVFNSSDKNVSKFVFESELGCERESIAVEAVLYKYESYSNRTVICCSTQCGCPVGCTFCGTGKFFVRNLTADEIVEQIDSVLKYIDCETRDIKKFQIMFMSMGDPFLNYTNLSSAIKILWEKYSNAQLLISTSAPLRRTILLFDDFINLSKSISNIGIQFSVHESNDVARSKLIPTPTCSLFLIGRLGEQWSIATGRKPFFNYCVHEKNSSDRNIQELLENFNPNIWECTLSVICEKDNTMQNAIRSKLELVNNFSSRMLSAGYSTRVFNPAGQDDIGGGCGQLWYFQEWLNKNK